MTLCELRVLCVGQVYRMFSTFIAVVQVLIATSSVLRYRLPLIAGMTLQVQGLFILLKSMYTHDPALEDPSQVVIALLTTEYSKYIRLVVKR